MRTIAAAELAAMNLGDAVVLDVRTRGEWGRGTIKGSINVPYDYDEGAFGEEGFMTNEEAWSRLDQLPKDEPVYVFCTLGPRSQAAAAELCEKGVDAVDVLGGWRAYQQALYS